YVSPERKRFDLFMRDRHGMAWRDLNDDGKLDVLIVRGALKGRIDRLPGTFADELLVQKGDRFVDTINPDILKKGNCPALQTAWVDADNDKNLDIFTLCYKPTTPVETFPPQLYVQSGVGQYQEQSAQLKLDMKEDGSFLWLDVDDDGDSDLFRSTSKAFILFRNQPQGFTEEVIADNPGGVATSFDGSNSLTIADYDSDGDLDIFAASETGNTLLQNDSGTLILVSPDSLGLPAESLTAQWVDYDNDGRMDLYSLPEGLFLQGTGQFEKTGLLRNQSPRGILEARATWFDADEDGDRDLITAINFRDPLYRRLLIKGLKQKLTPNGWFLDEYLNQSPSQNHWLTLDLKGPSTNAEAIGAQVDITSDLGTQRYQVGQSEGSHYSQGHYRIYVGLGQQEASITLKVRWPDGTVQSQTVTDFDQRLTLAQSA
ncbi:MAG: CRTAC1 family protein, partial [Cyanobacteria bacterium P01_F01_bin.42]